MGRWLQNRVVVMVEDRRTTCEEEEGKLDGEEMVVDDVVTEMAWRRW
jgi:hypothetical protein